MFLFPDPTKNKFFTILKTKSLDRRSGLSLVDYEFEISNLDLVRDLVEITYLIVALPEKG